MCVVCCVAMLTYFICVFGCCCLMFVRRVFYVGCLPIVACLLFVVRSSCLVLVGVFLFDVVGCRSLVLFVVCCMCVLLFGVVCFVL